MDADQIAALNFQDWRSFFRVSRRQFLKGFAGGIAVAVSLRDARAADEPSRVPEGTQVANDFNAFLTIGEDGRVRVFTGKIEMGQGVYTSQAQMVADELDAPLSAIDVVMGDTDLCPYDMGTWGSLTTRVFGPALRAAAAEARAVLLELAAAALGVPAARLVAADGVISDQQDPKRRIGYGELAHGKKIERHLRLRPGLKARDAMRVMGKPQHRREGHDKVTGKAHYAADVRLPGMLYAALLRPPAHGAKRRRLDLAPAKAVPGVQVVQKGDLVAVLHAAPDVAAEALARVQVEWDAPAGGPDDRGIYDHLIKVAPAASVLDRGGDLKRGEKQATHKQSSTFLNAYVAHAPMETHTALARVEDGRATIWASTQSPFGLQREAAEELGLPLERVHVLTPFVGGGFGGKSWNQQALEAARLSQMVKKPVQVTWSRAEEFFYDSFRPAAIVKIRSGLDGKGRVAFWDYDVYFAGERGAPHGYDFAHHRTSVHGGGWRAAKGTHPFATGAWRAPGNNTNTFARESQIDILAAAADVDPVEFRLRHLKEPRAIAVLKAAAERFGWTPGKAPSGRGVGVACGTDAGTYVASMCELKVDPSGAVSVKRIVCAQDMGMVVNPEGAKIQTEGGLTMGLGYALTEELRFTGGKIADNNFDTYEIPRFSDTPKIDSVFVDSGLPPQGGGEPAIIVTGALLANAIFDATGARLFALPMTAERIKQAMASAPRR
jgi:isoquinoline 1-oxidoreductase